MAYDASTFTIMFEVISSSMGHEVRIMHVQFKNANISALRHKVKLEMGSFSYTSGYTSKGAKEYQYQVGSEIYSQISATSTYRNLKVSLMTYSGSTQQGSTYSQNVRIELPNSWQPVIESFNLTYTNPQGITVQDQGIQGYTRIDGEVVARQYMMLDQAYVNDFSVVCDHSETIVQSHITPIETEITSADGETTITLTKYSITFYVNPAVSYGTLNFTVCAFDSRNRKSAVSRQSVNIAQYNIPTFPAVFASRCLVDGTISDNGTYALIRCSADYTQIGDNAIVINSTYYPALNPSQKVIAQYNMTPNTEYIIGDGNLDPDVTYGIEFSVSDKIYQTLVTRQAIVDTADYAIHVKNGGDGVAFGKASEISNAVEIDDDWDLYYKGRKIDIIEVNTPMFYELPVTFNVPGMTANYELLQDGVAYISNPDVVGSDWTITTGNGYMTIGGTYLGTEGTYIKAIMCDKQKVIATEVE